MTAPKSLATAFLAAQRSFTPAEMNGTNPHFKSRYARLSDVWAACVPALHAHGFAVTQTADLSDDAGIRITTALVHESGDQLASTVRVPLAGNTAQAAGSAITYARRYGLALACGIVNDDDDDGNAASATPPRPAPASKPAKVSIREKSNEDLARLKTWAEREGKTKLVDKISDELEQRREATT